MKEKITTLLIVLVVLKVIDFKNLKTMDYIVIATFVIYLIVCIVDYLKRRLSNGK